jgi:hypothetical protein
MNYRSKRSQQWGSKYDPTELPPGMFDADLYHAARRGAINNAIADLRANAHLLTDKERTLLIAIAQKKF